MTSLPATPNEMLNCLARNERRAVYDAMKGMDVPAWDACEELAEEQGFTCFNEMVAFYTIIDIGDDAPGAEIREKMRYRYRICTRGYSRTSESVRAVRDAGDFSLAVSSLYICRLQLALCICCELIAVSCHSTIACILTCLSLIWIGFRFNRAYSWGRFLRHAYRLFKLYGVQGMRAEGADR